MAFYSSAQIVSALRIGASTLRRLSHQEQPLRLDADRFKSGKRRYSLADACRLQMLRDVMDDFGTPISSAVPALNAIFDVIGQVADAASARDINKPPLLGPIIAFSSLGADVANVRFEIFESVSAYAAAHASPGHLLTNPAQRTAFVRNELANPKFPEGTTMVKDQILLANDGSIGAMIGGDLHEFRMTPSKLREMAGEMLAIAAVLERVASDKDAGGLADDPTTGNA